MLRRPTSIAEMAAVHTTCHTPVLMCSAGGCNNHTACLLSCVIPSCCCSCSLTACATGQSQKECRRCKWLWLRQTWWCVRLEPQGHGFLKQMLAPPAPCTPLTAKRHSVSLCSVSQCSFQTADSDCNRLLTVWAITSSSWVAGAIACRT